MSAITTNDDQGDLSIPASLRRKPSAPASRDAAPAPKELDWYKDRIVENVKKLDACEAQRSELAKQIGKDLAEAYRLSAAALV